jgi:hypothetical protein
LLTGGATVLLEGKLVPEATIVACCTMSSFAGLSLSLLPWLLAGGALLMHQPFEPIAFVDQCSHDGGVAVTLPGALVPRLADAGLLTSPNISIVLAAWRAPERLIASPRWHAGGAQFVDIVALGEIAVLNSRRGPDGKAQTLPIGILRSPQGMDGAITVADLTRTQAGTLAVRGPIVPRHPFPPGPAQGPAPHVRDDADGFVDTGYPCRLNPDTGTLVVTGPPPGLITVGGFRFAVRELEDAVRRADPDATLVALPDALGGHRLAGHAADSERVRAALEADGVNTLLVDAFRDRQTRRAA